MTNIMASFCIGKEYNTVQKEANVLVYCLISNNHTLHYLIDTATDAVTSSTTQQGGDNTSSSSSTTKYTRSDGEGTWWIVLSVITGICTPVFIFWIVIKVIQCRRLVDLLFTLLISYYEFGCW